MTGRLIFAAVRKSVGLKGLICAADWCVCLCRRIVEQLEVEHCLAEARRMAQLAVHESQLSELRHLSSSVS